MLATFRQIRDEITDHGREKKESFFVYHRFRKPKTTTLPETLFPSERASSQLFKTSKIIENDSLFMEIG